MSRRGGGGRGRGRDGRRAAREFKECKDLRRRRRVSIDKRSRFVRFVRIVRARFAAGTPSPPPPPIVRNANRRANNIIFIVRKIKKKTFLYAPRTATLENARRPGNAIKKIKTPWVGSSAADLENSPPAFTASPRAGPTRDRRAPKSAYIYGRRVVNVFDSDTVVSFKPECIICTRIYRAIRIHGRHDRTPTNSVEERRPRNRVKIYSTR